MFETASFTLFKSTCAARAVGRRKKKKLRVIRHLYTIVTHVNFRKKSFTTTKLN